MFRLKNKPVLLIIDDDELLCCLLSTMLYTKNVTVAQAESITSAHKILRDSKPALVFLDNSLPDGNGIDYISRLKTVSNTEVVLMTGYDDEDLEALAMSKGCLGFLQKPFSYRSVSDLVDKALKTQTGWYNILKRQYEGVHLLKAKK